MRPSLLKQAASWHMSRGEPFGVIGDPGVGKSEIIGQAARENKLPLVVMNAANKDSTDFSGLPTFTVIEQDGKSVKVVEWAKMKVFLPKTPIHLFLDELFQAPVQVMNVCAPIILEKRIDDIYLPEGSSVSFASNRTENKAGTNRVPSHLPNRCTVYYGPDVNVDDWAEWALSQENFDIGTVQYVRMKKAVLQDFDPQRLINATPRQWAWVGRNIEGIPEAFQHETIAGRVGDGYAVELRSFRKIKDQLPALERILHDPKRTKVPEEVSALYLVTGMLAQAAAKDTFDAICTYAERMAPEFQAMLVKDAMRLKPEVCNTKAFVSWGVKFAEVLR